MCDSYMKNEHMRIQVSKCRGIIMKGKKKIIVLVVLTVIAVALGGVLYGLVKLDQRYALKTNENKNQNQSDKNNTSNQKSDGEEPKTFVEPEGVVCWGDSLTVGLAGGYPKVLADCLKEAGVNIPVANEGVTSEGTGKIMARAGVTPYKVAEAIRIPEKVEPVFLKIEDGKEKLITSFPKGKFQYTDVTIQGIEGKLTRNSQKSGWNFTRNYKGESSYIAANTKIRFNYIDRYKNYIPIIFMGTNGGFSSIEDLIQQQQAILDTFTDNDRFLIIGLTHQTVVDEDKLDAELQKHWGKNFINLREYLSGQGVYDAGFKPKSSDLAQMKKGTVPDIVRTDSVHYKLEGYQVLGKLVFQRMKELGYVN